jgi:hypothetical protein
MYEMAKKGRAAMREKAKRLSSEVDQKTDSSNWSPSDPLNANIQTGMRPVSKPKFKKGGKVMGADSVKHAGRRGRKAGGRLVENEKSEAKDIAIAKMNRNQKEANESREGIKHEGGLKRGGRAKKSVGGMPTPGDAIQKGVNAMLTGNTAMKKGGTVKRKGHADGERVDEIGELIKTLPPEPPAAAKPVPKPPAKAAPAASKPDISDPKNWPSDLTPSQSRKRGGKARKEGGKVVYGPAENYANKPAVSTKEQIAQEKKQDAASKPTRGKAQNYADGGAPMNVVKPRMFDFGSGATGSPYKKGGKVGRYADGGGAPTNPNLGPNPPPMPSDDQINKENWNQRKAIRRAMGAKKTGSDTFKKGGKAEAHDDVAMDKKLIKKMVKPGARTGKFGGGALGGNAPEMIPPAMQSGMQMPSMMPNMGDSKPGGYKRGGKAKGKTNINIVIGTGKSDPAAPGGMPPGGPGGPPPGGVPIPMGMPPGGAPAAAPPMPMPMPMPAMPSGAPPMGRKAGGRISKVASSYKDMTAGAGSGEGRLQKADMAKRSAHKAGGGVYRSYKDMDAGSGSGLGRLEKTEIQKRK